MRQSTVGAALPPPPAAAARTHALARSGTTSANGRVHGLWQRGWRDDDLAAQRKWVDAAYRTTLAHGAAGTPSVGAAVAAVRRAERASYEAILGLCKPLCVTLAVALPGPFSASGLRTSHCAQLVNACMQAVLVVPPPLPVRGVGGKAGEVVEQALVLLG